MQIYTHRLPLWSWASPSWVVLPGCHSWLPLSVPARTWGLVGRPRAPTCGYCSRTTMAAPTLHHNSVSNGETCAKQTGNLLGCVNERYTNSGNLLKSHLSYLCIISNISRMTLLSSVVICNMTAGNNPIWLPATIQNDCGQTSNMAAGIVSIGNGWLIINTL